MLAPRRLVARALALRRAAGGPSGRLEAVAKHFTQMRAFSMDDGDENRDGEGGERVNGELNAFERLLQHSQQFRAQMEAVEGAGKLEDKLEGEDGDGGDSDSDSDIDSDDDDDEDEEEDEGDDEEEGDHGGGDNQEAREHAELARRLSRRRTSRESRQRSASISRSVWRRILEVPDDSLDYEHQLETLDSHRARERKFQQLLRRQQDANHVCRNCGERGHVARNCLLPVICSNCGGIGHGARYCPHPSSFVTPIDKNKGAKDAAAAAAAAKERVDRFKEEFEAEMDEYLDRYSAPARGRKAKSASKGEAASDKAEGGESQ